ncbi:MAG: hypothetical protein C5B49_14540 [Bdellovibrio sp.]|nr:MAG: hypothetical protein C5B49_14540 [Bdellovibrio sp.]
MAPMFCLPLSKGPATLVDPVLVADPAMVADPMHGPKHSPRHSPVHNAIGFAIHCVLTKMKSILPLIKTPFREFVDYASSVVNLRQEDTLSADHAVK